MNFIPQFEPLIEISDSQAVFNQVQSGWVGTGEKVEEFEKKLSEITGNNFVISITSGTTALMMAIASLEIDKDKVILFPAYTFLAGANAARFLGYHVELVDINENTLCMDLSCLVKKIKDRNDIGCIIFVNHNGYVGSDLQDAKKIAEIYSIPFIEDSAQCMGIEGAFKIGELSILSFSVPKLISTGQGGAILTNSEELSVKLKRIRDHGDNWRKTKIHEYLGVNFKFNDILASYGLSQLNRYDEIVKKKKEILDEYSKYLNIYRHEQNITWMVIYRTLKAKEIISSLAKEAIQAVQYYLPVSHNPPYKTEEKFICAEKIYFECIYLPSSLNLKKECIEKICEIIGEVER